MWPTIILLFVAVGFWIWKNEKLEPLFPVYMRVLGVFVASVSLWHVFAFYLGPEEKSRQQHVALSPTMFCDASEDSLSCIEQRLDRIGRR